MIDTSQGPRQCPDTWHSSPLAYVEWYSPTPSSAQENHGLMYRTGWVIQQQYIQSTLHLLSKTRPTDVPCWLFLMILQIFVCCLSLDSASHASGPVSCIDIQVAGAIGCRCFITGIILSGRIMHSVALSGPSTAHNYIAMSYWGCLYLHWKPVLESLVFGLFLELLICWSFGN